MKNESSFLFKHLSPCERDIRIKSGQCAQRTFSQNSAIKLPKDSIGVLLSGVISVYKTHFSGKRIIMNTLTTHHVFGIVDLFLQNNENPSEWVATETCSVLVISGETLMQWLQADPILLKNYLKYVHGRIQFLNHRIDCFTYDHIKERVAYALTDPHIKRMNKTQLAEYLGISRASLYRVLKMLS